MRGAGAGGTGTGSGRSTGKRRGRSLTARCLQKTNARTGASVRRFRFRRDGRPPARGRQQPRLVCTCDGICYPFCFLFFSFFSPYIYLLFFFFLLSSSPVRCCLVFFSFSFCFFSFFLVFFLSLFYFSFYFFSFFIFFL